ncbi:phosphoribosyl pyrophosphate synthase-associated protein 1-like [Diaphorina citri]|uniref:Phosphoribosyl pyrophosphate synthase-associated protein 1-like n=1 Tax=Diaphorina citri TaxID=121845 RepID=A0A1S3CU09_DIACI|nr:phosphoribosyl pyrophosphate synthase-associated protein 1-like [Diaphorina citri]
MDVGPASTDIMILSGNSATELAGLVASRLGVKLGACSVYHKTNRETMVEIGDSVRGKDIYIIQTGTNLPCKHSSPAVDLVTKTMPSVDGRASPPPPPVLPPSSRTMEMDVGVPQHPAKEKPPISVVGDVGGRVAIMVDDMVDDVHSFVAAAEVLKDRGAYKIYVLATHGLLSSDAPLLIEESPIDEVVVTNTIPHDVQKLQCPKIKTVDISILLSEAIRRMHNKESMSYLFRNVTLED